MAVVSVRTYKCMVCGSITTVTKLDVNKSVRCKKCNSTNLWLKEKVYKNDSG